MELEMAVRYLDGTAAIALRGEIDLATAPTLAACIDDALTHEPDVVELDMSGVEFLDSAGIRVLIGAHRRLGEDPKRLVLKRPNAQLRRVLEVTGVDDCVTVVD
jgi:anti-sigma B factor antagonist